MTKTNMINQTSELRSATLRMAQTLRDSGAPMETTAIMELTNVALSLGRLLTQVESGAIDQYLEVDESH